MLAMVQVRQKPPQRRRTFLREWREHIELTQEQASEYLELTQGQLSRIERGATPYSQDFLERAAVLYKCEPADLLIRNPENDDAPWEIYNSLRNIDRPTQERVRNAVEAFIGKTDR